MNNPYPQPTESCADLPTSGAKLLEILENIGIKFELFHHEAVFTVAESNAKAAQVPGQGCRNLFLRDKKEAMFLVVAAHETKIDLKKLSGLIAADRLSFGSPDRLWRTLGVRPGSVCPFAVINDKDKRVKVVLDAAMMQAERVAYHPLENHMSVVLTPADLLVFLRHTGHEPDIIDLSPAAPDAVGDL